MINAPRGTADILPADSWKWQAVEAIARQGQRPEKLKHEMAQDGSLSFLYVRLREEKALDKVLESAEIEEVEPLKQEQ